jgi:hypothetical protein
VERGGGQSFEGGEVPSWSHMALGSAGSVPSDCLSSRIRSHLRDSPERLPRPVTGEGGDTAPSGLAPRPEPQSQPKGPRYSGVDI